MYILHRRFIHFQAFVERLSLVVDAVVEGDAGFVVVSAGALRVAISEGIAGLHVVTHDQQEYQHHYGGQRTHRKTDWETGAQRRWTGCRFGLVEGEDLLDAVVLPHQQVEVGQHHQRLRDQRAIEPHCQRQDADIQVDGEIQHRTQHGRTREEYQRRRRHLSDADKGVVVTRMVQGFQILPYQMVVGQLRKQLAHDLHHPPREKPGRQRYPTENSKVPKLAVAA